MPNLHNPRTVTTKKRKKTRTKICDCRINFHDIKNKVLLVNTQTLSYIFQKVDLFLQGSLVFGLCEVEVGRNKIG